MIRRRLFRPRRREGRLLAALERMRGRRIGLLLAMAGVMVALIGMLDFATGYEAYFAFIYLLPVSFVTWYVGGRHGLLCALICATVWLVANHFAGAVFSHPLIMAWNFLSRAAVLALCSVLFARLREALIFEQDLAHRLKQSLGAQRRSNRLLRERLRTVEQLAAGVAHEVRNPLGVLISGTEFLARRGHTEPERSLLEDMRSAVASADQILESLINFSAPPRLELSRASLSGAVRDAVAAVRHRAAHARVELVVEDLPSVEVRMDLARIGQVLVNVLNNAIDASRPDGPVRVRIRMAKGAEIGTDEMDADADVAVVEIDDDGDGASAEALARAFEPFYTTKDPGAGVGLGLSVSRRIVDDHGGMLRLDLRHERGVRASLLLPTGEGG